MEPLNLDKFKIGREVTLNGQKYYVRGMTVKEMAEMDVEDKLKQADSNKVHSQVIINILTQLSDIPEDVLEPVQLVEEDAPDTDAVEEPDESNQLPSKDGSTASDASGREEATADSDAPDAGLPF